MTIDRMTYPMVLKALQIIDMDGGGNAQDEYHIPTRYAVKVADAEVFLKTLDPPDFDTFCTGEEEDAERLAKGRFGKAAAAVLNAYVNGELA